VVGLFPHGFSEKARVARCPHDDAQRRIVEAVLQVWKKAFRRGFARRAVLSHIADDAHDRHGLERIEHDENHVPERIAVTKRLSRQ
jgi:hypothetical protein